MKKLASFLLVWLSLSALTGAQQSPCQRPVGGDLIYSPCQCQANGDGSVNVTCLFVSNDDIRNVFRGSIAPDINEFQIVPLEEPTQQLLIEADLLSGKRARIIKIASCTSKLEIDQAAFTDSSDYTELLSISECDIDLVNFEFLKNFNQMTSIVLTTVSNIRTISTLPALVKLDELSIAESTGFDNPLLIFPTTSLLSMTKFSLIGNIDLDNRVTNKILSSIASKGVALRELIIIRSPLINQIPDNVVDISSLVSVDLSSNSLAIFGPNAFNFTDYRSVRIIDLSNNKLNAIPNNAFSQGDYGNAIIRLDANQLTKFRHEVYLEVLDEMNQSGGGATGQVSISGNDIFCGNCELAWLIRDNRELLPLVVGGTCDNGTAFKDLLPEGYDSTCAIIKPTTPEISTVTEAITTEEGTAAIPTTETTTTSTVMTTQPTSVVTTEQSEPTTTSPVPPPPENSSGGDQLLLYIALGLVGVILLVLIIGFIYFVCTRESRRRGRRISEVSFDSDRERPAAPIPARNTAVPTKAVSMSRAPPPSIPRASVVPVQGPGGNWYIQSSGASVSRAATSQPNQVMPGPSYPPRNSSRVGY